MYTLIALIVLSVLTGLFWTWACLENTTRIRSAIRSAIDHHRDPLVRPVLRLEFNEVTYKAHLKRELLMRNPLPLYSPAINRLIAEELNLDYPG